MVSRIEEMAGNILSTPKGAAMLSNIDNIMKVLNSPDGRKLMEMVGGAGGDALKKAASAAAQSSNPTKTLINGLMSTQDGSALITQIFTTLGKK